MRRILFALALLTLAPLPALAQEVTATPMGEYLVRFRHTEGQDFAPGNVDNFVRHRARLGMKLAYGQEIMALLQIQDVRTWGEETDTLADYDAGGIDFHQAYLEAVLFDDVHLRLGRQEISYLNHRLIGNVGFVEQARSFDAARLMAMAFDKSLAIDLFYARTRAELPADSLQADDVMAYAVRYDAGLFQPALIGVLDLNSATDRVRFTQGLVVQLDIPFGLKASVEGYVQAGGATINDADVNYFAWMAATRVRFTLVDLEMAPFAEVLIEVLSGDDDPTDADEKTFDTLFATNHKFYGEADFFLNIPAHTKKKGLLDAGLVLGTKIGADATAQVAFHLFEGMEDQGGESSFGQEIDLTFGWKPNAHLSLDLNYSVFLPGAAFSADGDPEHFVYSTASTTF